MKKSTLYIFLVSLAILAGALLFYKGLSFSQNKPDLEDALVKTEDLSKIDFYARRQETHAGDYYNLTISEEISNDITISIVGRYPKDGNRELFLNSGITKYTKNAKSHFENSKNIVVRISELQHIEKEFMPEFESSSYYQYRQCAIASEQNGERFYYACVVSSIIKDDYLFTLVLHGDGRITSEEIEYILGTALKDKHTILERLP